MMHDSLLYRLNQHSLSLLVGIYLLFISSLLHVVFKLQERVAQFSKDLDLIMVLDIDNENYLVLRSALFILQLFYFLMF